MKLLHKIGEAITAGSRAGFESRLKRTIELTKDQLLAPKNGVLVPRI